MRVLEQMDRIQFLCRESLELEYSMSSALVVRNVNTTFPMQHRRVLSQKTVFSPFVICPYLGNRGRIKAELIIEVSMVAEQIILLMNL